MSDNELQAMTIPTPDDIRELTTAALSLLAGATSNGRWTADCERHPARPDKCNKNCHDFKLMAGLIGRSGNTAVMYDPVPQKVGDAEFIRHAASTIVALVDAWEAKR